MCHKTLSRSRRSESAGNWIVPILAVVMGVSIVLPFSGCQTLEEMAPPVGVQFQTVAARRSVDVATLELGRQVYLSDCVRCHGVEPIGRYSATHWREILPRMALETKLDDRRTAAVTAYVMMARTVVEQNEKRKSEHSK